MARMYTVVRVCVFLISFLVVGIGVAPGRADTYTLEVNPLPGYGLGTEWNQSSFWITYTDTGTDRLLVPGESIITAWSGVTDGPYVFPAGYAFAEIPYVDGYVNGVGVDWAWYWLPKYDYFGFAIADAQDFSYAIVPIPPSALLLGAGLIPLAWARRKKRLG